MTTLTPVWDSLNGDREYARLAQDWKMARLRADIDLAQFGTFNEFARAGKGRTGRGLDALIPLASAS